MAIDWTKPIQHHSGTEAILLPERDGEDNVAVAYRMEGSHRWLMLNSSKQDAENYFSNVPTTATATEKAQPEIDWAGEVQVRSKHDAQPAWTDVIIAYHDNGVALGWEAEMGPRHLLVLNFDTNEFRNKPAEPKRVKAILKLWRSAANGTLTVRAYLKNKTTTVESVRVWHPEDAGKLLSVVEIDLHEGEGLECEK